MLGCMITIMNKIIIIILKNIKQGISFLEKPTTPFINILLTFVAAIILHCFFVIFRGKIDAGNFLRFLHHSLHFVAVALTFILAFHFLTRVSIEKTARVVLPSFFMLISVPIINLLLCRGDSCGGGYLSLGGRSSLFMRFLTFFWEMKPVYGGVTPGMRIAIAFVLLISYAYLIIKTQRWFFSLLGTFFIYVLTFVYAAVPILLESLLCVGIFLGRGQHLFVQAYLTFIVLQGFVVFYRVNKHYFVTLLKDIRPYRLLHNIAMFFLGLIIAEAKVNISTVLTLESFFSILNAVFAIVFACVFSIISNNIVDRRIDEISNPNRPLIRSDISFSTYQRMQWFALVFSVICAAVSSAAMLLFILVFICVYYIYSKYPFRLKRILFFSKFCIAFNSLVLIFAGYQHFIGSLKDFPKGLILYVLIGLTFINNFIDIKDEAGDRNEGILTLPVLLGAKRAKVFIGLSFVGMYAGIGFLIQDFVLYVLAVAAGWMQFYLVNKSHYDERWIFLLYLGGLIGTFFYYLFFLRV